MSSEALIRLRSPAAPSAGSGSPSVTAISTCVTKRACAEMALAATSGGAVSGMPAARPRTPETSALATGALTRSSDATRRVHRLRPQGQVVQLGPLAFLRRRVLPVVAGQVHLGEMRQRVAPVQLRLAVGDLGPPLERGQVRLVVRIIAPVARGGRRRQPGQAVPYPAGGEILDPAVVLVASAVLAHVSDVELTDRPDPGRKVIHDPDATGPPRPAVGGASGSQTLAGVPATALHRVHAERAAQLRRKPGTEQVSEENLTYSAVNCPGGNTLSQCAVTGWQADLL